MRPVLRIDLECIRIGESAMSSKKLVFDVYQSLDSYLEDRIRGQDTVSNCAQAATNRTTQRSLLGAQFLSTHTNFLGRSSSWAAPYSAAPGRPASPIARASRRPAWRRRCSPSTRCSPWAGLLLPWKKAYCRTCVLGVLGCGHLDTVSLDPFKHDI